MPRLPHILAVQLTLFKVGLQISTHSYGVDKVLKKQTKSYKNELRYLFQTCILIPRKCPLKTPFQHTVPPPLGSHRPDIRIQEICINFCEQQVLPLSCTISTVEKGLTLESKIQTTVRIFILQIILFEIDCALFYTNLLFCQYIS